MELEVIVLAERKMYGCEVDSGLQYRVKSQARIGREFESGERYLKLEEQQ